MNKYSDLVRQKISMLNDNFLKDMRHISDGVKNEELIAFEDTFYKDKSPSNLCTETGDALMEGLVESVKMTPKEVSTQLRLVAEKHKNDVTPTFRVRIADMAKDAADAIDSLQAFVDHIALLPTCNTCSNRTCKFRPAWSDTVRYNCPLYMEPDSKTDKTDD